MSSIEQIAFAQKDTESSYQCELFSRKAYLKNHIQRHQSTKRHPCSLCTKTFSSKGHLTAHMLQHHNKIKKRFHCSYSLFINKV